VNCSFKKISGGQNYTISFTKPKWKKNYDSWVILVENIFSLKIFGVWWVGLDKNPLMLTELISLKVEIGRPQTFNFIYS
jgi:hypothetical protein